MKSKKVATIILNRNLPKITDNLYNHLKKYDGDYTDIFIVEAGSNKKNLSVNYTWHADWKEATTKGLRYSRGMNFGLSMLSKENKYKEYDYFFLITNDTILRKKKTLLPMLELFDSHERLGILSPCSAKWGEKDLLKKDKIKYFWFIHNNAYMISKDFIDCIKSNKRPGYMHFLFDGNNFRGFLAETELIAKAYANDFAAAITSEVFAEEDESHLLNNSDLIKTEKYDENLKLYIEEGLTWIKEKYGFSNRWMMQQHAKNLYDSFFLFFPEYEKYKI